MKHEPTCDCKECTINRAILKVTKEWGDRGQIIEGGWQALLLTGIPKDAPEIQLKEMRKAYYLGAQHLFASILMILEPGTEATEGDIRKMDYIHQELDRFMQNYRKTN